jgi:hypothetical protein
LRTRNERRRHADKETDELAPLHACLPDSGGHRNDLNWDTGRGGRCPLWVKSRHVQRTSPCPLCANRRHCTRERDVILVTNFTLFRQPCARRTDVRFGLKADMCSAQADVRFVRTFSGSSGVSAMRVRHSGRLLLPFRRIRKCREHPPPSSLASTSDKLPPAAAASTAAAAALSSGNSPITSQSWRPKVKYHSMSLPPTLSKSLETASLRFSGLATMPLTAPEVKRPREM